MSNGRGYKYSEEAAERLKELVDQEYGITSISRKLGVSINTARRWLEWGGLEAAKRKTAMDSVTDKDIESFRKAIESGISCKAASRLIGVTCSAGENLMKNLGLKSLYSPVREYSQETLDKIYDLEDQGVPVTWIADTVGMTNEQIRKFVKRKGNMEWKRVWPKIRSNDTLLELHREFAPKAVRK